MKKTIYQRYSISYKVQGVPVKENKQIQATFSPALSEKDIDTYSIFLMGTVVADVWISLATDRPIVAFTRTVATVHLVAIAKLADKCGKELTKRINSKH